MSDIFPTSILSSNLKSKTGFFENNVSTTKFDVNPLRNFVSKVWSLIHVEIKNSSSVEMF